MTGRNDRREEDGRLCTGTSVFCLLHISYHMGRRSTLCTSSEFRGVSAVHLLEYNNRAYGAWLEQVTPLVRERLASRPSQVLIENVVHSMNMKYD